MSVTGTEAGVCPGALPAAAHIPAVGSAALRGGGRKGGFAVGLVQQVKSAYCPRVSLLCCVYYLIKTPVTHMR